MIPVTLSTVKPDYESLLLQLQLAVQSKNTWIDLQTTGVGETLLENMSAVGAFNQFGIESAFREAFLTAYRDSSIYAIADMLGVRIKRKYPTSTSVVLTRKDGGVGTTIPRFTQFDIQGKEYFNRVPIVFTKGSVNATERIYYGKPKSFDSTSVVLNIDSLLEPIDTGDVFNIIIHKGLSETVLENAVYEGNGVFTNVFGVDENSYISLLDPSILLYQGTIKTEKFTADGSAFNRITLSPTGFIVSDYDVDVYVSNEDVTELWENIDDGLWNASATDQVYYDSTNGDGSCVITFGNGVFGAMPKLGDLITVKYASTLGSATNNGLSGLDVSCSAYQITGKTTSVMSGGSDQETAEFYRVLAPYIYRANNRANTRKDYAVVGLSFPGVSSVSVQTQKDIAPNDLRWMNVVRMCVLPNSSDAFTESEWFNFLKYMDGRKGAAIHIDKADPIRMEAHIDVTIALNNQYLPTEVVPSVESAINKLFQKQFDTLGKRIAVSDIVDAVMSTSEGIDYVDVHVCRFISDSSGMLQYDLVPTDVLHWVGLGKLTVNSKYSERVANRWSRRNG